MVRGTWARLISVDCKYKKKDDCADIGEKCLLCVNNKDKETQIPAIIGLKHRFESMQFLV